MLRHRQRINTPEDLLEAQPTRLSEGSGALVFDGRLDDRAGLSEELGVQGNEVVPDSRLVALAFQKWGPDAAAHLIGVYAFAIVDTVNRRLILSVDANGSRPLYFHTHKDLVTFSTVLPALLCASGVPRDLDEAVLADLLANDFSDNRASFFKGVFRVLGATTVVLSTGSERVIAHSPYANIKTLVLRDDREYVEGAREVLDKAVASALRSLRPVPLMGSGGLDSSCLAVSALGVAPTETRPLVTVVPEAGAALPVSKAKYASEQGAVEALRAAFPRLAVRFVEPSAKTAPDLRSVFETVAVPLRVTNLGWPVAAYQCIRNLGATAFLDGSGGNFTLTWNGLGRLGSLLRNGKWVPLIREAAAAASYRPRSSAGYIWRYALKANALQRKSKAKSQIAGADLQDVCMRRPQDCAPGKGLMNRTYLSEYHAWIRAAFGLEARLPLTDVRLVRYCRSIPEDQFLRNGKSRWLARRLLAQAGAPDRITGELDRGANCPDWFTHLSRRKSMFPDAISQLRTSQLASRLIDIDRITHVAENWPADAAMAEQHRFELELIFNRALQVGAFIQWAEAKDWVKQPGTVASVQAELAPQSA